MRTKDRLSRILFEAGLLVMGNKAQSGDYDDFDSRSPTPIVDLVRALEAVGRRDLADRAIRGEWDSTEEEAKNWVYGDGISAFMNIYKLTNAEGLTRDKIPWGENVTHEVDVSRCNSNSVSDGWIRVYDHPIIALLMDPIMENFGDDSLLWEAVADGQIIRNGTVRIGAEKVTTLRIIKKPIITPEQRVRFAIACAWPKSIDSWRQWATGWLRGQDRTRASAESARKDSYELLNFRLFNHFYKAAEAAESQTRASEAAETADLSTLMAQAAYSVFPAERAGNINIMAIAEWSVTDQTITELYE